MSSAIGIILILLVALLGKGDIIINQNTEEKDGTKRIGLPDRKDSKIRNGANRKRRNK
ncbi:MAG: hypothetical protein KA954_11985 [Chitinophagales bacterium]|nr:hypothetical protein [Bacteroidota bacterium]MBP7400301.1 hypothetical protein [Chitinophagales bacterium]MBP8754175.1 hypothetical protein [Chitinophagales bacterium]MBP9549692.1 hypothetical protein [Chitinophagales bacterium]MBP9704653.1 hypothetical protein [Chitinophagales bacterium]